MTADILHSLASRTATLHDRLHGKVRASLPLDPSELASRRDAWCEAVSYTGEAGLQRRVQLAGCTLDEAMDLLGEVTWREDEPLPGWVHVYEAYATHLRELEGAQLVAAWPFAGDDPAALPFQEILRPFADVARERLRRASGVAFDLLSPLALQGSLEALLRTLVDVARAALSLLWHEHAGQLAFAGAALADEARRQPLRASRRALDEIGPAAVLDRLHRYPVCLRRLCLSVEQWADSLAELLLRAQADLPGLQERFGAGSLSTITRLRMANSDPHHGGRRVVFLEWDGNTRVVYKPRSQGNEALFFELTARLNRLGAPEPLAEIVVWDRGAYGWMEYIASRAIETDEDTETYLRQFGAILACLHVLVGEDFHQENLIFDGRRLVPVDHEVLFAPSLQDGTPHADVPAGMLSAIRATRESVLTTAMLPTFRFDSRDDDYRVSGGFQLLGGARASDARRVGPSVRRAFEATYRHILGHRDALSPWIEDALGRPGVAARCVLRDTYVYGMLGLDANGIERERSAVSRSLVFERLWRAFLNVPYRAENLDRLVCSEIDQLERGDFPYFICRAQSCEITDADGAPVGLQAFSNGHERWRRRFAELGEDGLAFQVLVLERALDLAFESTSPRPEHRAAPLLDDAPAEPCQVLEDAALAVGRRLCEGAIEGGGGATWMGPFALAGTMDKFCFQVLGADMHSGLEGIAVFLQALLSRCPSLSEDPRVGPVTRAACAAVRVMAARDGRHTGEVACALGFGSGLGGRIYSLALLAELSGDPSYDALALGLARIINDTCFPRDPYCDVMRGAAGAILGLLAAHERAPNDIFVDRAVRCAEHLLRRRIRTPRGYQGWDTGQAVTTGFGHGAAGFALAFARLAAASGEARFAVVARESLELEDSFFLPEYQEWADPRGSAQAPSSICGWCAGTPGILLARLEIERLMPGVLDPALVEVSAEKMWQLAVRPPDHACCGVASRAEALLELGAHFHRPAWVAQARRLLATISCQAGRLGGYQLFHILPREVPSWGFFQGMAGIGYTLLRGAHRESLPSILSCAIKSSVAAEPWRSNTEHLPRSGSHPTHACES